MMFRQLSIALIGTGVLFTAGPALVRALEFLKRRAAQSATPGTDVLLAKTPLLSRTNGPESESSLATSIAG